MRHLLTKQEVIARIRIDPKRLAIIYTDTLGDDKLRDY